MKKALFTIGCIALMTLSGACSIPGGIGSPSLAGCWKPDDSAGTSTIQFDSLGGNRYAMKSTQTFGGQTQTSTGEMTVDGNIIRATNGGDTYVYEYEIVGNTLKMTIISSSNQGVNAKKGEIQTAARC